MQRDAVLAAGGHGFGGRVWRRVLGETILTGRLPVDEDGVDGVAGEQWHEAVPALRVARAGAGVPGGTDFAGAAAGRLRYGLGRRFRREGGIEAGDDGAQQADGGWGG
ncbi:MAG: hypothetical protein PHU80_06805 [Kiritimatiellae bacterium]|nr:hypothetical protein [Kiritimatiellia bacterium]